MDRTDRIRLTALFSEAALLADQALLCLKHTAPDTPKTQARSAGDTQIFAARLLACAQRIEAATRRFAQQPLENSSDPLKSHRSFNTPIAENPFQRKPILRFPSGKQPGEQSSER